MSSQKQPLVTVLITAYNSSSYLKEAVSSATSQNYNPLEVLVVDDGSKPSLEPFLRDYDSSKVRYIGMEHKGLPHGLIKGVEEAKGEYIAILDHDDMLTEGSIEKRLVEFEKDNTLGMVYGDVNYMDSAGKVYGSQHFKDFSNSSDFIKALFSSPIAPIKHGGAMFKRQCIEAVGNYDPLLSAEFDDDMFIRMAKKFNFKHLNETVLNYRTHNGNESSKIGYRLKITKHKFKLMDKHLNGASNLFLKSKVAAINLAKVAYLSLSLKRHQSLSEYLGLSK